MDARTSLRRRVGDTPLQTVPNLAEAVGLPKLRVKLEGANPTGTQKDRVARLEVGVAVAQGFDGLTIASCGNFGVAVAHAAFVHGKVCHVFIPASFRGERVTLMEELGATVHEVDGSYEDAVAESRNYAKAEGLFDANPGGSSTLRTLAGYSRIAAEIVTQLGDAPAAIGAPIGNGSTLAGVQLGFRVAWAAGSATTMPKFFGGSSQGNNPVPAAFAREQERCTPLDPRSVDETEVNEPLVNWDAMDGTACLTAIQDSQGAAYGFEDDELMGLHAALLADGIDAHPASLSAAAALRQALHDGHLKPTDEAVVILTSGRPEISVDRIEEPDDVSAFSEQLAVWLGKYGDPQVEMLQAIQAAFKGGHVLVASDHEGPVGYLVLTPMELDVFFPKLHLSYVAVDPRARGKGVGTVLLEEAIRVAEGDLSLHVDTDNEAATRLYEKFGFTKKYYRMLYKPQRTPTVDPAEGSGWA